MCESVHYAMIHISNISMLEEGQVKHIVGHITQRSVFCCTYQILANVTRSFWVFHAVKLIFFCSIFYSVPVTPTSPSTPSSPESPALPVLPPSTAKHTCNHLHTIGGVGGHKNICNRCNQKKWPLMRRSSSKKFDRRSHIEVTVLSVGRCVLHTETHLYMQNYIQGMSQFYWCMYVFIQ